MNTKYRKSIFVVSIFLSWATSAADRPSLSAHEVRINSLETKITTLETNINALETRANILEVTNQKLQTRLINFDFDGDGYTPASGDCNDADIAINPSAPEVLEDGIDNDCDGVDGFVDLDGDGYDSNALLTVDIDCDDSNPNINPGMNEIVGDGIDNDCNKSTTDNGDIEYKIGYTGPAGGIIFYLQEDMKHGMEVAPVDTHVGTGWGCGLTDLPSAMTTIVGGGFQTTLNILDGCKDSPAAHAAEIASGYILDGLDGWYLPTRDELALIQTAYSILNREDEFLGSYWSSSHVRCTVGYYSGSGAFRKWNPAICYGYVWEATYPAGNSVESERITEHKVRAVRHF
jgi:hypothetical protein